MVYVTRRTYFSASHRLYNPSFSEEPPPAIFDKCTTFNSNGHNYVVEVTVAGIPDPATGYVIDLKLLKAILDREIIDKVDHKHLNFDVDFLRDMIPTAENIAIAFWQILEPKIPHGKLHTVRVFESDNNFVEYRGEPVGSIHLHHLPQYAALTGEENNS